MLVGLPSLRPDAFRIASAAFVRSGTLVPEYGLFSDRAESLSLGPPFSEPEDFPKSVDCSQALESRGHDHHRRRYTSPERAQAPDAAWVAVACIVSGQPTRACEQARSNSLARPLYRRDFLSAVIPAPLFGTAGRPDEPAPNLAREANPLGPPPERQISTSCSVTAASVASGTSTTRVDATKSASAGSLSFDANGLGNAEAVAFATFAGVPELNQYDFVLM
jgi:hypothetical protein